LQILRRAKKILKGLFPDDFQGSGTPTNQTEFFMLEKTLDSNNYLKFLTLVQEVRVSPEYSQVSLSEERLLNLLASAWNMDQRITVLQAMNVDRDISHSTSHRLLKSLRLKNFIKLMTDERDTRVKYVLPTDKTNQYFTHLGRCLDRALKHKAEPALAS
jgi:DNA-binding MarR family transcriptional regulator